MLGPIVALDEVGGGGRLGPRWIGGQSMRPRRQRGESRARNAGAGQALEECAAAQAHGRDSTSLGVATRTILRRAGSAATCLSPCYLGDPSPVTPGPGCGAKFEALAQSISAACRRTRGLP